MFKISRRKIGWSMIGAGIFVLVIGIVMVASYNKKEDGKIISPILNNSMKIQSEAFQNNSKIPDAYSCYGKARAIPLRVLGVPSSAASLVIVVNDPDAPSGDFVHWIIWNIPSNTSTLSTDNPPDGSVEGVTSLGKPGFVAPCPPAGTHHYNFKLYALNTKLDLPASANRSALQSAMDGHILESSMLTGLYGRQK